MNIKKTVDKLQNGISLFTDDLEKRGNKQYIVAIYVRDINDKTEDEPDGKIITSVKAYSTPYDRATFLENVKNCLDGKY